MERGHGKSTSQASARALHRAALDRLLAGDPAGGVEKLHQAIRVDPSNQELIATLEVVCTRFDWVRELARGLLDAHAGGNRHPGTLAGLVAVSVTQRQFAAALEYLRELKEISPTRKKVGPWSVRGLEEELTSLAAMAPGRRRRRRSAPASPTQSTAVPSQPAASHSSQRTRPASKQPDLFASSSPGIESPSPRPGGAVTAAPAGEATPARAQGDERAPHATASLSAARPLEGARSPSGARSQVTTSPAVFRAPAAARSTATAPAGARPRAPAKPALPDEPPLLPRIVLDAIPVQTEVEGAAFLHSFEQATGDGSRRHALCLMAHRLAMVNSIDELLCLPTLRGVQEFWYQVETVRKVLRRFRGRALLCDEVGLGKTIEAGMVVKEYLLRGVVRSVLILVPPALVTQWKEELETKFGLSFVTTGDRLRQRDPDLFWQGAPLCIASLTMAKSRRNFARVVATEFDLVVVDEAHHLKNRDTQAWKLVNAIRSRFLLLLTATPIHNSLVELHNIITLLKPGQLKTRSAFMQEFVSKSDPTAPINERKLRELLSEVMIRNTRALAGINLPPRRATTVCVEPRADERALYERLASMVRAEYRGRGNGQGLDRMTLRLLQCEAGSSARALLRTLEKVTAARHPDDPLRAEAEAAAALARAIDGSAKLEALKPLLARGREQIIVFVGFRGTLDFLAERLEAEGIDLVVFHGGLTAAEKEDAIEAFRRGVRVLLTTEVGGEGRNLQFCHRMVNFDLPWNPMRIEQRIGRIHRIGQERETEVWNICARGSVEDHLLEILDRKINMFELVIGEVDMILGQMEDGRDFSERVLEAWASAETEDEVGANFQRLSAELGKAKGAYERIRRLDTALFGEDYEV